jgi:hypothetical protein
VQSLDAFQRWFLGAVTAPETVNDVERHVSASQRQSAAERLAIYQHAYTARLLEVLQSLFPCTGFAIGGEQFSAFAAGYLRAHPPSSYTLTHLAEKFDDYLETTRPDNWGQFVVELVRLEQAIDRVFDCPGPEGLPPFCLPEDKTESIVLEFVPGLELHRFGFPVSNYFTEWKAGREPEWPESQEQCVALIRRDYIVRRYELSAAQYTVLSAIRAGRPLREALAEAAVKLGGDVGVLADQFHDWFCGWSAEHFFARVSAR